MKSQITTSPAHEHDAAEGSSAAQQEMGMCADCGRSMLPASISRHFKTACKGNPNLQWHQCPQCPREFTRMDALKRHRDAPQACPGSTRATTLPGAAMGPGPSRTARTRVARRKIPYIPSPASSSSSSSARHRYISSSNTTTPATSVSPPVCPNINFDPTEECHGGAPLDTPAQFSSCMGQYSRYFEQPRARSSPADQFCHHSHVPQPALSADFRSTWDLVLQPYEDSGLEFLSASAASVPATVDTEYPQPVTSFQQLAPGDFYPAATQEPSAFDFLEPAFPQVDYLGEHVEFDAQYPSDLQDPLFLDGFPRLSAVEPQSLWELDAGAAAPNGDFGGLRTDIFDYIVY